MRGEHPAFLRTGIVSKWVIPACAGNIPDTTRPHLSVWGHPRMRGEHPKDVQWIEARQGSSPHARGTSSLEGTNSNDPGVIPACAGNIRDTTHTTRKPGGHPRMRGEHHWWNDPQVGATGSSPHARGTCSLVRSVWCIFGVIPACAGNMNPMLIDVSTPSGHPRMRGEHT